MKEIYQIQQNLNKIKMIVEASVVLWVFSLMTKWTTEHLISVDPNMKNALVILAFVLIMITYYIVFKAIDYNEDLKIKKYKPELKSINELIEERKNVKDKINHQIKKTKISIYVTLFVMALFAIVAPIEFVRIMLYGKDVGMQMNKLIIMILALPFMFISIVVAIKIWCSILNIESDVSKIKKDLKIKNKLNECFILEKEGKVIKTKDVDKIEKLIKSGYKYNEIELRRLLIT